MMAPAARHSSLSTLSMSARTTCSIQTTASPSARILRTMATRASTSGSVRPPATSSSSNSFGPVASALAISSRLRWSNVSCPARRFATAVSSVESNADTACAWDSPRRRPAPCWAATTTFSNTVMFSKERGT